MGSVTEASRRYAAATWSCMIRDMPQVDESTIAVTIVIGPLVIITLVGALVWWIKSRASSSSTRRRDPPSQDRE